MGNRLSNLFPAHRGQKLTSNILNEKGALLANNVRRPFKLCFEYKLEKGFDFSTLEKSDLKAFQKFLDIICQMSITEVDARYQKKPDISDMYNSMRIVHYEITRTFRIHGVIEQETFKVIRLDPNHKFHK